MPKKTPARKGKTTNKLTASDRRKLLESAGWRGDEFTTGTYRGGGADEPENQAIACTNGRVMEPNSFEPLRVSDAQFRSFVKKYAPVVKEPPLTLAKLAAQFNDRVDSASNYEATVEARFKTIDKRLTALESCTAGTDHKAASVEALNELRELVLKLEGFNNRNADAVRELRNEFEAIHLGLYGKTPDGRFEFGNSVSARLDALESRDTMADFDKRWDDAVARNEQPATPAVDAPYGEAERRADAIAAGWVQSGFSDTTFYPVLVEINTPDIDDIAGAHVRSGRLRDVGGEWRDATPAEFRAHLAKYAVKREPDATPDERRRELERRGVKVLCPVFNGQTCYSNDGKQGTPHAWTDGVVYDSDRVRTETRTLAEFCAALDAVGLVAKGATAEERAKLCEAWGPDGAEAGGAYLFNMRDDGRLRVFVTSGSWWMEFSDGRKTTPTAITTTLADLEAALRKHLPYDREWREKVARKAGWVRIDTSSAWRPPTSGKIVTWVNVGDYAVILDNELSYATDRAAWLKFIRDNTPKVDPLDVANKRIAELAAVKAAIGVKE